MGKRITIEDADFQYFLYDKIVFDINSINAENINVDYSTNTLTFENGGMSSDFNWVSSSSINSVKITIPSGSPVSRNAIIIGVNASDDALVFYLDGAGQAGNVYIFSKTGVITSLVSVYLASNIPDAPKGTEITFTKITGGINVSYTGYSQDILNADITGFKTTSFGVLATGSSVNTFTFEQL